MSKKLELWQFIASRLENSEPVMLLVVAESSGSSPGRASYKMAVGADGELCGSIGGGVMEVRLVEQAKELLSEPPAVADGKTHRVEEQVHRKDVPNSSGMICSGKQTVIFRSLSAEHAETFAAIISALKNGTSTYLTITPTRVRIGSPEGGTQNDFDFEKNFDDEFTYCERLGPKNELYIVGGGHCALALSDLMSKMDFLISIFDDRPELNTLKKNQFADEITIIDTYENISDHIPLRDNVYVVVMTLGYRSDALVLRKLLDRDLKYFGVLGSKAKMKILLRDLESEGFDKERLAKIRTPIGLPINSRSPEEIAVSIAAEIIAVKNS